MSEKTSCCGHACHAPAVPAERSQPSVTTALPEHAQRLQLHIANMDCPTEEALIRRTLAALPGVLALDFDLLNRRLTVHHQLPDAQAIHRQLAALGLPASAAAGGGTTEQRKPRLPLVVAGMAAVAAEALAWYSGDETSLAVAVLALVAVFGSGLPTLKKGWIALRHFSLNIHLLMTAAVLGALTLGQWPEAAMVIWLFALAERLEAASLLRARDAIRSLQAQAPESALLRQADGSWQAVATALIQPGQLLLCRPGDRIALDGVVQSGSSCVNQAAISGESVPVEKQAGDTVYAGTLNQSGALQIRVTARQADSMLARIAHSVQEAQSQRAPIQRLVDRFAAIYTPAVFACALLMAILPPLFWQQPWHASLYRALVLLVIACPCALVLATPVTVVSGLALAARRGIVVKGGLYLEQGRKLRLIAFDKTGTLTDGRPRLNSVLPLADVTAADTLRLAASLDAHSSHPLAQAVLAACPDELHAVSESQLFQQGRGRGISGRIAGRLYHLGNRAMFDALQASTASAPAPEFEARLLALEQQGNSVLFLCREDELLGVLAVADPLRSGSRAAIAELQALGVRTVMLSGDNPHTAQAIAAQAGIAEIRSRLLPEDKLAALQEFCELGVCGMVGDGINDAPALARADIGFAMAAGSDTALETADVALLQNDLRKLPEFIRISRRTTQVLRQNIAFALAVKGVFFALALSGHASLWMAVFADTGASLLVVLNGVSLLRYADQN